MTPAALRTYKQVAELCVLVSGVEGILREDLLGQRFFATDPTSVPAWSAALAMFAVAALLEAAGVGSGWTPAIYKAYYLLGGLLNVGWLAVGTVYLLASARVGHGAAIAMALLTLLSLAAVGNAHVDVSRLHTQFPNRALDVPAIFPALINSLATLVLVGGAAWSAFAAYRRHAPPGRVAGTALIAAGALVVGADHSVAQLTGLIVLQPISEAIGIVVMFGGYLAIEVRSQRARTVAR